jgi:acetyl-CoA synthetase
MANDGFNAAQACLIANSCDLRRACAEFSWPKLREFNWAIDWFDDMLASGPRGDQVALRIIGHSAETVTFRDMAKRSNQIANGLARLGIKRGDRILLMLGNVSPLWETMIAAMKLGAVVVPSTLLLTRQDIAERISRARIGCVVVSSDEINEFEDINTQITRIAVGEPAPGWTDFRELREAGPVLHAATHQFGR